MLITQRIAASTPVKGRPVVRRSDKPSSAATPRDVADNGRIRLGGSLRLPPNRG